MPTPVQPATILRGLPSQTALLSSASRFVLVVATLSFAIGLPGFAQNAPDSDRERMSFDVPAGEAESTLRQFAEQSRRELVYPADALRGVHTNAVKGRFSPLEAINRMLADTGFVVVEDQRTAALAIRRKILDKNDGSPAGERTATIGAVVRMERLEIVGSSLPGPVNQGVIPRRNDQAVAFQILDRTAIDRSGAMSLGELFRDYPGNSQPGLGYQSTYGASLNLANGIPDTSDRLNLRGLGTNKTIVLLNGRRLYGSDTSGPDVSRIPLSAVERVEILPGAAAAIYGANAVGGAVNIITKRSYTGGEVTAYAGTSTKGGATEWHASVFDGFSIKDGRTTGTVLVEHIDRGALRASQREYWKEALERIPQSSAVYRNVLSPLLRTPRALITTTSPTGLLLPANPTATVTVVPPGYNNPNPTALDFNGTVGQIPIGTNRIGAVQLQNPMSSTSVNFQGEHRFLRDRLEAYVELAWRYQQVKTSVPGIGGTSGFLSPVSPVNPFRTQPAAGWPVGVAITATWDPIDLPYDPVYTLQRTARAVGGFKGKLGEARKWAWALDYSYDRNEGYSRNTQYTSFLNQAIPLGVYTPFRDLERYPNTTPLNSLATLNINRSTPEVFVTNVRISGELWTWRAGAIALSAGGERRTERIKTSGFLDFAQVVRQNNPFIVTLLAPSYNGTTNASRTASAAYAELTIPVFGGEFRRPLIDSLDFSMAVRQESYGSYEYRSTFGDGLTSKTAPDNIKGTPATIAVRYRPVRDVALRASYSDAFVSPTMNDLFRTRTILPNASPTTFFDPVLGTTVTRPVGSVTITSGGNPSLRPELGRSYNYGVILTPRWLHGFTANVDYFKVISYDQIRTPALATILTSFPERVTRDAGNQVVAYDTSTVNMSVVVTSGADVGFTWTFDTETRGTFTWSGNATYVDTYRLRAIRGNPFIKGVGDLTLDMSAPLRARGLSSLYWTKGRLTAGVSARYTGHYKNNYNIGAVGVTGFPLGAVAVDGKYIRSQLEFDAQCIYQFERNEEGWKRLLSNTSATLGVRNLTDRRPPYSSASFAFYSFHNDPRQRYVYLELKRKF